MTPEEAELLKNIGQQVRYHRRLRNFTQEELGERASICHKYLGEIERGNKNIGLLVICRIARALQISPADLM
ncbi:MAG: helix-turn-helix transcriptional regulator, partial [Nitrospirae bacterium]|nr:helix-turn-helix transcriptional regulator [Nitrospirota bacterium]